MDVKELVIDTNIDTESAIDTIDSIQRRALARLGLSSPGPYVAPTLLVLRSSAAAAMPGVETGAAA